MESIIIFYLKDNEFKFPCSMKLLKEIPAQKYNLSDILISQHKYYVKSPVQKEIFQSFLDFWQKGIAPELNSHNIWEYFLLSEEFGIMNSYLSSPQFEKLFNISYLVNSVQNSNANIQMTDTFDKSIIEKRIAEHLNEYLSDSTDDLFKIPISSLYNIFNHQETDLVDHSNAYNLILNAAQKQNSSLYVLLSFLDGNKISSNEIRSQALIQKEDHFGFAPINILPLEELKKQSKEIDELKKNNEKEKKKSQNIKNLYDQIAIEKMELEEYKNKLSMEITKLKKCVDCLTSENQKMKDTNHQLSVKNQELSDFIDKLTKEKKLLELNNKKLLQENEQLKIITQTSESPSDKIVILRPSRTYFYKENDSRSLEKMIVNKKSNFNGVLNDILNNLFTNTDAQIISYCINYNNGCYDVKIFDPKSELIENLPPFFNVQVKPNKYEQYRICTLLKSPVFDNNMDINKECFSFAIHYKRKSSSLKGVHKAVFNYLKVAYEEVWEGNDEYMPTLFSFANDHFDEINDVGYIEENELKPIFVIWRSTDVYDYVTDLIREHISIKEI